MLNIMTVLGTRPELIKLSRVIPRLDKVSKHTFVHTGQNSHPGLSTDQFVQLGVRQPDVQLSINTSDGPTIAISEVLFMVDRILGVVQPDAFVVYGDTNSCMSVLAAKRCKIPIFHIEAGNRCFDQRVPEEINRKVIDHLSDVNMCLTERARRNLASEGLPADRSFVVGSPMDEVIGFHKQKIAESTALGDLRLEPGEYFLVSMHREENVDNARHMNWLFDLLSTIHKRWPEKRIIMSMHPRTASKIGSARVFDLKEIIEPIPPQGFLDWIKLQDNAFCVLSDSGTLSEESAILGFPAVMLRQAHERQEGIDMGNMTLGGLNPDCIVPIIEHAIDRQRVTYIEDDGMLWSHRVVSIILGYTDYVRRVVWHQ